MSNVQIIARMLVLVVQAVVVAFALWGAVILLACL
jgi:hypothetical protein